jgi:hypothetical protein
MTITQTLTTILLILGFAILLFIFYKVYSSVSIDDETCRQSVILRASAGYIAPSIAEGLARDSVSLKCRTSKICITSGFFGGSCSEFIGEKGVTKIKVKDLNQLQKIYAEEILNCWSMMGEGKLDLFSEYRSGKLGLGKIYPSCVVCSRVALDKEGLAKAGIDISRIDIERYMSTHLLADKNQTYLSYIGGERGKISIENINLGNLSDNQTIFSSSDILKNDTSGESSGETGILFMQITAPSQGGSAKEIGSLIFGGTVTSFSLAPITTGKSLFSLGRICALTAKVCVPILAILGISQQGMVAYNRAVAAGKCSDVTSGTEARNGCSVVRSVNYNETQISEYCSNIESIP